MADSDGPPRAALIAALVLAIGAVGRHSGDRGDPPPHRTGRRRRRARAARARCRLPEAGGRAATATRRLHPGRSWRNRLRSAPPPGSPQATEIR